MQISQKQGGWSKSHEKKPIRLEREYFFNHITKVNCGRNLKGIGRPRPGPLPVFSDNDTQLIN